MGYESLFEAGVQLLSEQFESMKLTVSHQAWIGEDGDGADQFAAAVPRRALVDLSKRLISTKSGRYAMTFATLTFLDPIASTSANTGKTRENPVDPRDIFTLPDGSTAPVVSSGGFADSTTIAPFALEVVLGTVVRGE